MCSQINHTSNNYERIENYDDFTTSELAKNYENILKLLGEDSLREGLDKTPERVAKAMQFLLQGYKTDPVEILKSALFKENYRQMVIVKDIEIYSMCEHHLLPFFGKAHVAYIPNGTICLLDFGIAKLLDESADG
ncbi:MAG TPA: GTP cyclohydrolase I, partial [Draconibacterium sp.]|nr:GTP cyclohydrolase I [Draconibacterium sp.]